jgi:hypothetical protein
MPDLMSNMLTPALGLIVWTFVVWAWMYATRIPAMQKAGIAAGKLKRKSDLDALPLGVQQIADNYNHLHEQPTVFYALAVYSHLVGVSDVTNIALAWLYVVIRIVHSLIQATSNYVPVRFFVFVTSSVVLIVITARNVWALFGE